MQYIVVSPCCPIGMKRQGKLDMQDEFQLLIEESIKAESNASELYALFANIFPEDTDFWNTLAIEERNHAALITSIQTIASFENSFPKQILSENLESLIGFNKTVLSAINTWKKKPLTRGDAFNFVLILEEASAEAHFQTAMVNPSATGVLKVLQDLNTADKNHAKRIRSYMKTNGIRAENCALFV